MTDTELVEALAAKIRAVSVAPLGDLEVHEWDQVGSEDPDGSVVVRVGVGTQVHIALGEQLMDNIRLEIVALIPHGDSQANRREVASVRKQIVDLLRGNRKLSVGGETAQTNARENITWEYGTDGEGEKLRRYCLVSVTYEKVPDDV